MPVKTGIQNLETMALAYCFFWLDSFSLK